MAKDKTEESDAEVLEAASDIRENTYKEVVREISDEAWGMEPKDEILRKGLVAELVDEHPWIVSLEKRLEVLQLTDHLEAADPLKLSTPLKAQEAIRAIASAAMTADVWDKLDIAEQVWAGEEQDR